MAITPTYLGEIGDNSDAIICRDRRTAPSNLVASIVVNENKSDGLLIDLNTCLSQTKSGNVCLNK